MEELTITDIDLGDVAPALSHCKLISNLDDDLDKASPRPGLPAARLYGGGGPPAPCTPRLAWRSPSPCQRNAHRASSPPAQVVMVADLIWPSRCSVKLRVRPLPQTTMSAYLPRFVCDTLRSWSTIQANVR